jgi:sigma-E factor negative regulatory protein RseA
MNPGSSPPINDTLPGGDPWRSQLSALGDGELAHDDIRQAVQQWSASPEARRAWHEYQLIGDVLRSDELGGRCDEPAFLARLRVRLDNEPVVLAPAAASQPVAATVSTHATRRRRIRWLNSAAIAAGFAAVAAVLVVLNPAGDPGTVATPMAGALPSSGPVIAARDGPAQPQASTPEQPSAQVGPMIRDPGLDAYLDAHRQFGANAGLGVAPASIRPVTTSDRVSR